MTKVAVYLICCKFKKEVAKVWNSNGKICGIFFPDLLHLQATESDNYNLNFPVFCGSQPLHLIRWIFHEGKNSWGLPHKEFTCMRCTFFKRDRTTQIETISFHFQHPQVAVLQCQLVVEATGIFEVDVWGS
jgi:hypothetical protein